MRRPDRFGPKPVKPSGAPASMEDITLVPLDEPARGSPAPLPFARPPRQAEGPGPWVRAHRIGTPDDQDLAEEVVYRLQQRGFPVYFDADAGAAGDLFAAVSAGPPDPALLDYILSVRMEGDPVWLVVLDLGGDVTSYENAAATRAIRLDVQPDLAPQQFDFAMARLDASMRDALAGGRGY